MVTFQSSVLGHFTSLPYLSWPVRIFEDECENLKWLYRQPFVSPAREVLCWGLSWRRSFNARDSPKIRERQLEEIC